MFKHIILAFMLAPLSLGVQVEYPFGPEVRVRDRTGREYNGEILALRDSSLVFSLIHGADSSLLAQSTKSILLLPNSSILEISLPGSSRLVGGMLIGAPTGCAAGALIGALLPAEEEKGLVADVVRKKSEEETWWARGFGGVWSVVRPVQFLEMRRPRMSYS